MSDLHLFFDLEHIEMLQDVTQVVHAPKRHPANPLIRADRPWEEVLYFAFSSGNVLFSPHEDLYRVWYEDLGFDQPAFNADVDPFPWDHMPMHYLYAESRDGIVWHKPALDVVSGTNIVFGAPDYKVHVMSVLDDPRAQDSTRRFKALYVHPTVARGRGHEVLLATSPDGIHWTPSDVRPRFAGASQQLGDVLILSFDEHLDRYVLLCRHPAMHGPGLAARVPNTRSFLRPLFPGDASRESRRRVFRSESDDLVHWTEPELIYAPDTEDNWDDSFYGMVQLRRGSLLIGLLPILHAVDNSYDVHLAYSRDGRSWKRVERGQPYLGGGEHGAWDRWCVNVTSQPIVRGDEMWIYYGGAINHHDYWLAPDHADIDLPETRTRDAIDHGLGLATLRLDGFVSARATLREGILATHLLPTAGQLVLNASCGPGGSVDVELADADNQVVPGYSRAECDTFRGDSVGHRMTWQGRGAPPAHASKLRFFLRAADLFSFRFADR